MKFENIICSMFKVNEINKNALIGVPVNLLKYILQHFLWFYTKRNCKPIVINNRCYASVNISQMSNLLGYSHEQVRTNLWFLEGKTRRGKSSDNLVLVHSVFSLSEKSLYLSPDVDNICNLLAKSTLGKKYATFLTDNKLMIENYKKYCEVNGMLFDVDEITDNTDKNKVALNKTSKEAKKIVDDILTNNRDLFSTKIPKENGKVSDTYLDCLIYVKDIYNGAFVNPRMYQIGNVKNSSSIDIDGWRDEVKRCKGNWDKVKSLLNEAVNNFRIIHQPEYLPYNKDCLQKSLSMWLFNKYHRIDGEGYVSQFTWCVVEPQKIIEKQSELKAEHIKEFIRENIGEKTIEVGEKIYKLNMEVSEGYFWNNIMNVIEWITALKRCDFNAKYMFTGCSDFLEKFYRFVRSNNIIPTANLLNIENSVKYDGAWVWFIKSAVKNHEFKPSLAYCTNADSIYKLYKKKKISKE